MSDSEEFYQKFEGYVIPKKKPEPVPEVEIVTEKSDIEVQDSDKSSSPSKGKRRKVSKRSASSFLGSDSDDESEVQILPGCKDPLGLDHIDQAKTYGKARTGHALEVFQSQFEGPLPSCITRQCTSLECKLCNVKHMQHKNAVLHYAGKAHMKMVQKALVEWKYVDPINRQIPALKQSEVVTSSTGLNFYQPGQDHDESYCHVCRIELSSKIVADSHYQGKNHAKQLRKIENGTYVDPIALASVPLPKKPRIAHLDQDIVLPDKESRQGISISFVFSSLETGNRYFIFSGSGNRFMCLQCKLHFRSNEEFIKHLSSQDHKETAAAKDQKGGNTAEVLEFTTTPTQDSIDDMLSKLRANPSSAFDCSLCQVQCSSQVTLSTHLNGKQHLRKLEMSKNCVGSAFKCTICNVETTDQNGLDMHIAGKKHQKKVNALKMS